MIYTNLFLICLSNIFMYKPMVMANPLQLNKQIIQPHEIDIEQWFDNKGFGENGNLDDGGNFFSGNINTSHLLVNYKTKEGQGYDNIKANGQMIPFNITDIGALYMLVTVSHGPYTTGAKVIYKDGTTDTTTLSLPDWKDTFVNQMDRYQAIQYATNKNGEKGALFSVPLFINPTKTVDHLVLPLDSDGYEVMHVFAVTAYESSNAMVTQVQPAHEWINYRDQIILVKIHNTHPSWIRNVHVNIIHNNVKTVKQGFVDAVAPGHIQTVQVIVQKLQLKQRDVNVMVTIIYHNELIKLITNETNVMLTLDSSPTQYQANTESVQKHRPPTWLKQSKFGIFIHWGLFSVPAWAPVGEAYAEWYWWRMSHKDDVTFEYHRQTYGENFEYDNFLSQWKPTQFDPHGWLDLIDKSGATYFVFTTKHHDGIALFDTSVTNRSTMTLLEPSGRDFVKELMNVSKTSYPHLKRGLYFSLPEWYHPKYKDESLGWEGPPKNPYTNQVVSYTGSKLINDFVNELQVPQFQELTNNYNPDILWCDIGGIHNSTVWQSNYFNNALKNGQQVAVNDRCGEGSASDFKTVEYKAVTDAPSRFWEATRGMDPYSFGYNRETKTEEYASTFELTKDLVDAVSKGGNFLLNIGPEASGNIPMIMSQRLIEIGQWLNQVHASIFDSVPYWITSSEGDNLRFTANLNGKSIYIFSFIENKNGHVLIKTPLPFHEETVVSLMNYPKVKMSWNYDVKQGGIVLNWDVVMYMNTSDVYVFEITTK